jgi:hypothetical protein
LQNDARFESRGSSKKNDFGAIDGIEKEAALTLFR